MQAGARARSILLVSLASPYCARAVGKQAGARVAGRFHPCAWAVELQAGARVASSECRVWGLPPNRAASPAVPARCSRACETASGSCRLLSSAVNASDIYNNRASTSLSSRRWGG